MDAQPDFFQAAEAMFERYSREDYAAALQITEALAAAYPEEAAHTAFWRICLLCRNDRIEAALQAMMTAMDDGLWWSENQLRSDPDLTPLQGLAAFERLITICNQRQQRANEHSRPALLLREPYASTAKPLPLLIALHGRGASPRRELRYWLPVTELGWLLAQPQSSQLGAPDAYIWDDIEKTAVEIAAYWQEIRQRYPLDERRILLAGFSQGAARAVHLALSQTIPVRGFLAIVPGKVEMEHFAAFADTGRPPNVRGYIVSGGKDPRFDIFRELHRTLNAWGICSELENHPEMAHQFPPDFETTLQKAITFLTEETQ